MSTFKISFEDAVKYIKGFVDNFEEVATNEALGGTLLKDRIDGAAREDSRQYRGNMAWYCYKPNATPPNPKLFISFEESNEYEDEVVLDEPDLEELRCPSSDSVFRFPGGDVKSMFESHQPSLGNPVDLAVSKSSVVEMKNNFLNHPVLAGRNQRPYGFFENKDIPDVEELLNYPGVVFIRYYFGYVADMEINKIRLVLVGADANGKNIVPSNREEVEQNDAPILQTSWPPRRP